MGLFNSDVTCSTNFICSLLLVAQNTSQYFKDLGMTRVMKIQSQYMQKVVGLGQNHLIRLV